MDFPISVSGRVALRLPAVDLAAANDVPRGPQRGDVHEAEEGRQHERLAAPERLVCQQNARPAEPVEDDLGERCRSVEAPAAPEVRAGDGEGSLWEDHCAP